MANGNFNFQFLMVMEIWSRNENTHRGFKHIFNKNLTHLV